MNRVEKGYDQKLTCSKTTKRIILTNVLKEYIKNYPEREGEHIPQNSLLIFMAKNTLGKDEYELLKKDNG